MTADPIAAARALIAAQPDLLFRCDLCPDECNCHPHHDMSMSGGNILCDGCEDFDAVATPPDPLKLIATLADALEAERAENQRLREALKRVANYREESHAHDDDMGHIRRCFDVEAVMFLEAIASAALRNTEANYDD